MTDYAYTGKKGTGKSKNIIRVARDTYFWMGLGMFIPSNASAIMACLGSVWIATGIYKVQKDGIMNFGS